MRTIAHEEPLSQITDLGFILFYFKHKLVPYFTKQRSKWRPLAKYGLPSSYPGVDSRGSPPPWHIVMLFGGGVHRPFFPST